MFSRKTIKMAQNMKNKGIEQNSCSSVLNYRMYCNSVFPLPLPSPAHLTLLIVLHSSLGNNLQKQQAVPFLPTIQTDNHVITATVYISYCTYVGHCLPTAL